MNVQYISDSTGKTTGVFIPISEWNELKAKYKEIENEPIDIPTWQINEVQKRFNDHERSPEEAMNFDLAMDDIENNI